MQNAIDSIALLKASIELQNALSKICSSDGLQKV